jgi:hypothetical protein
MITEAGPVTVPLHTYLDQTRSLPLLELVRINYPATNSGVVYFMEVKQ